MFAIGVFNETGIRRTRSLRCGRLCKTRAAVCGAVEPGTFCFATGARRGRGRATFFNTGTADVDLS